LSPGLSENRNELIHRIDFVQQLSEDQFAFALEAGWTVSGVLAHLAFWDLCALELMRVWEMPGAGPSPMDSDIVNEGIRSLLWAIPPRAAVDLVIDAARRAERAIAVLSRARVADIETNGATQGRMHLGCTGAGIGRGVSRLRQPGGRGWARGAR
jgi:hypothetical protein